MTTPSKQGSHFWFITIQASNGKSATVSGTVTPGRGKTRLDLFNDLLAKANAEVPGMTGGSILAFDVQPNQI